MKVYFSSSASELDKYKSIYQKIYDIIENLGHTHMDDTIISITQDEYYNQWTDEQYSQRNQEITKYIKKADIVVLEVSPRSTAMGYWTQFALQQNKPVILLHKNDREPSFVVGDDYAQLQIIAYGSDKELTEELQAAFEYAEETQDVRFNFFISPRIGNYLDWVAQTKKIPRSVYLRNLIEKDMAKHPDYEG